MATLCISGVVIAKAGDNAPVLADSDSYDKFIEQAEGTIANATRRDWVAEWPTISGKSAAQLLEGTCSDLAAINVITTKLTGQDGTKNRIESEDQINVLRDSALRGISILRDKKTQTFIDNAA